MKDNEDLKSDRRWTERMVDREKIFALSEKIKNKQRLGDQDMLLAQICVLDVFIELQGRHIKNLKEENEYLKFKDASDEEEV